MKNKLIAGNWKMNKTAKDAREFLDSLVPMVADTKNTVVVFVPFTNLSVAVDVLKNTNIAVGAQNCHFKDSGAYTGEISIPMLKEIGVEYVLVGHSERRAYFNETDETVNEKTIAALEHGLKPIVCIGETLSERQSGKMQEVLKQQIERGFNNISADQLKNVVVAYEPVWAIGTGVTATNDEANDSIEFCRGVFASMFGMEAAKALYIQYGGSMNEKNAEELLSMPQIDGGLIGGASLVAEKFAVIVNAKK